MKILSWNVRGASRRPLGAYIKDPAAEHNMQILIMLETKTTAHNANGILSLLHNLYPSSELRFANGASGGFWVFWDSNRISLTPLHSMDQHLSFSVKPARESWKRFFLSVVYASPSYSQGIQLWQALQSFATAHITEADPWLLTGDFNSLLSPQDKQGGRWDARSVGHKDFQQFLDSVNLNDLGFVGTPFTWSNNRSPPQDLGTSRPRLGQPIVGKILSDFNLHHLPRIGSDHCPLLLRNDSRSHTKIPAFRFENMWLLQPGFHMVL